MYGWDFEVNAESRFQKWNLIMICVRACDMNSTLGPLCLWQCLLTGSFVDISCSCEIWCAKEEVSRLLISSETGLTPSHLAHLALHNSQVITNFRSFLQLWLCLDFGLGLWILRLVSETHGVEFYFQFKSHELHQYHLAMIARAFPNLKCQNATRPDRPI